MGQWQKWVEEANMMISPQRRSVADVQRMRAKLSSMAEPMPDSVEWRNVVQRHPIKDMKGSLLEFMLSIGDMGGYAPKAHNPAAAEIVALGDDLVARGAKPSHGMIELALTIGLFNLDGPQRLEAAFRWGAKAAWNPQRCLAICAGNSFWAESGGKDCWDQLVAQGALAAPTDFKACAPADHPILAAALESDAIAIKRALSAGIGVDWRDPATGATLWHVAAILSNSVGKALASALSKQASGLASSATVDGASFQLKYSELKNAIRKGQTPLHCACDGVKPAIFAALLACGSDPNVVDERGDTPLTILSRRWGAKAQTKGEPMVRGLLTAGADAGWRDGKGKTAAQNMAAKGPLGALAELLETRPEDVGASDKLAKQAFDALASRGAEGVARAEEAAFTVAVGKAEAPAAKRKRSSL